MLGENIRSCRQKKGLNQGQLAGRLHVVRQTVSKWEQNRSVPDAALLMELARVLEVPVSTLLGTEPPEASASALAEELARVNEALVRAQKQIERTQKAGEKRGLILSLCLAAVLTSTALKSPVLSLVFSGGCVLVALAVLYQNLELLTEEAAAPQMCILRLTTWVTGGVVLLCIGFAVLTGTGRLVVTPKQEKLLAMGMIAGIMVFSGAVSPRLPFSRHTGLRLPWTVRDADTWRVAHRVLGWISLPIALLYVTCALTVPDFEVVTLVAVALWVGVPAVLSLLYYKRKYHC